MLASTLWRRSPLLGASRLAAALPRRPAVSCSLSAPPAFSTASSSSSAAARSFCTTSRCAPPLLLGLRGRGGTVAAAVSPASRVLLLHGARRAQSTIAGAAPAIASEATAAAANAQAVPAAASAAVGWWLLGTSASVFAMVVVGGITRLTRSGLSMTDWRPQGKRWPRNDDEWEAEFAQYREFPEYQRLYKGSGFDLDDFKKIFFWEWFHRMFGRGIGVVFAVPLAAFAARGMIPRSLAPTLGGLLLLGGSQGLVGWWMVRSGLDAKAVDEIDGGIPRVSPYRLATHLTCAFTIFTILLYTGLGVLQPRAAASAATIAPLLRRVHLLSGLIGVTAISGAFVAGMQAGYAFNTFPLMEGRVIPDGYFALTPAYRNFFESVPSVQLHHRVLALTSLASVTSLWVWVQRMPLPPQLRLATDALLLAAWAQVSLGVATVVNAVPVHLGSAHQAGALTLFSVVIFTLHSCRQPYQGVRMAARWSAAAAR